MRGTAAAEALAQAHAGLTDPVARGTAAIMLARTLLFMENPARGDGRRRRRAAPSCRPSTRTCTWRCARSGSSACSSASPTRRTWPSSRPGGAGRAAQGPGAKTLTAITVAGGRDPERRRATRRRRSPPSRSTATRCRPSTAAPSRCCRRRCWRWPSPASAEPRVAADPRARGPSRVGAGRDRRRPLGRVGEPLDAATCVRAIEQLERAMEGEVLFGSAGNAHMAYSSAFLALRLARARATASGRGRRCTSAGDRTGPSDGERFWMISHAELLLADAEYGRGPPRSRTRCAASRPPDTHPLWSPWRSLRARAAAGEGDRETASRLAAEELALARRSGAPWVVGRSLRRAGRADRRRGRAA